MVYQADDLSRLGICRIIIDHKEGKMGTILVVVTFLAGNAWGPSVQMIQAGSKEACAALSDEVSKQIANAAKSNLNAASALVTNTVGGITYLTVQGGGNRHMATLRCS